jgi:hypothetical protein
MQTIYCVLARLCSAHSAHLPSLGTTAVYATTATGTDTSRHRTLARSDAQSAAKVTAEAVARTKTARSARRVQCPASVMPGECSAWRASRHAVRNMGKFFRPDIDSPVPAAAILCPALHAHLQDNPIPNPLWAVVRCPVLVRDVLLHKPGAFEVRAALLQCLHAAPLLPRTC